MALTKQEFENTKLLIEENLALIVCVDYAEFRGVCEKYPCKCKICGLEQSKRFYSMRQLKAGCTKCRYRKAGESQKLTESQFEEIKKSAENMGQKILLDYANYVNRNSRFNVICKKCGKINISSLKKIKLGYSPCKDCSKQGKRTKQRFESDVAWILSNKNIMVLINYNEYKGAVKKIPCECQVCKFKFESSVNRLLFKDRNFCPSCQKAKQSNNRKQNKKINQGVIEQYEKTCNAKIISDVDPHGGICQNVQVRCNICGEIFAPPFRNIINLIKCPSCLGGKRGETLRKTSVQLQSALKKISEGMSIEIINRDAYKNNKTKLEAKCNNCGNTFSTRLNDLLSGHGCPKCWVADTNPEKTLFIFLDQTLRVIPEKRNRKILKKLEIDLFCKKENLGVEYHGNYWHSSTKKNGYRNYHKTKYNLAKDAGINLIQIFEDEYTNNPELVHSIIRYKVDKPLHTYDAASCTPGSITEENLKAFMAANSFEPYDEYDARVELGDGSKTLAVLLWRKDEDAIRFKYVVARDTKVTGGLKRLLGTITPFYPNCALETASDARYSLHDKELEACGFTWSHITEPDRFYCVDNYKTRIPAVGENADGLPEIYGVGHNVFVRARDVKSR